MTAPAPPATQLPPQEGQPVLNAATLAVLAALALYLVATVTAGAVSFPIPTALIRQVLRLGGIRPEALRTALRIARSEPLPRIPHRRVATRATARGEPLKRAAYVVAAARRITAGTRHSGDQSTVRVVLAKERRFFRQHVAATRKRASAARQADSVATESGTSTLRWVAVLDDRTTPDCAALDGTVFDIRSPPGGTYPGQRHVRCRCTSGPA